MSFKNIRPFQLKAIDAITEQIYTGNKRILAAVPAGMGITAIIWKVVDNILHKEPLSKILIIVPGREMVHQFIETFQELTEWDIRSFADSNKFPERLSITIDVDQNIVNLPNENIYDILIVSGYSTFGDRIQKVLSHYQNSMHVVFGAGSTFIDEYGFATYEYSIKSAIEDGVMVPLAVSYPTILPKKKTNFLIPKASKEVLNNNLAEIARSIISESPNANTLIIGDHSDDLIQLVIFLNQISKKNVAKFLSETDDDTNLEIIDKFNNSDESLKYLCVKDDKRLLRRLSKTSCIAILFSINSIDALDTFLSPFLFKQGEKDVLYVLDYVGLVKIFETLPYLTARPTISHDKTNRVEGNTAFKRSKILIKDKKDINSVLGVADIAGELADLIQILPGEKGEMIGIFGRWGRGKSFLLNELWKVLRLSSVFTKVEFHAWKFQDTPATWAYLYECLLDSYLSSDHSSAIGRFIMKNLKIFKLNVKRQGYKPIISVIWLLAVGVIAIYFFLNTNLLKVSFYKISGIGLTIISIVYSIMKLWKKEYTAKAKDLFLTYSNKHSYKEHLGLQAEIQKETVALLKSWIPKEKVGKKKVILFIEDIDRCNEYKIIQLIDSLRVFLEDDEIANRVIIIAAVDEKILKLAIRNKYHSLLMLERQGADLESALLKITNEYLDKLFITGIKLGELSIHDADDYLLELTKGTVEVGVISSLQQLQDNDAQFEYNKLSPALQEADLQDLIEQNEEESHYDYGEYEEEDYRAEYLGYSEDVITQEEFADDLSKIHISNQEQDILRASLIKFIGATPRQIRIYFYRYLLAKNLLMKRYKTINRTNIWIKERQLRILATLLIAYTMSDDLELLNKHLQENKDLSTSNQVSVHLMKEIYVGGFDYKELLRVLNMVIAY
jgi:hypothetical protein